MLKIEKFQHFADDFVWTRRFRPDSLADCLVPNRVLDTVLGFVDKRDMPHVLVTGPGGVGKTTLAFQLARELGPTARSFSVTELEKKYSNGVVRGTSFTDEWTIFIDDADKLKSSLQSALKLGLDEVYKTRWIFATSHPLKLQEDFHSRLASVSLRPREDEIPSLKKRVAERCFEMAALAGCWVSDRNVFRIVDEHFPNIRRVIAEVQAAAVNDQHRQLELDFSEAVAKNASRDEKEEDLEQLLESVKLHNLAVAA